MGSRPGEWLSDYFFNGPKNNALLFKFADAGFNVYFSVSRGNPGSDVNDYYTPD